MTPVDDTVVVDTLDPRKVRIIDSKQITWLLNELGDPTTSGEMFGRMERSLRRQVETLVIGATGSSTDGAKQFYSVLNNLASGIVMFFFLSKMSSAFCFIPSIRGDTVTVLQIITV